jgi:hypothetical protein
MTAEIKQRPRGRPRTSTRRDGVVKVDKGVLAKASYVARIREIPLAEYVTELLRGLVERDFERIAR